MALQITLLEPWSSWAHTLCMLLHQVARPSSLDLVHTATLAADVIGHPEVADWKTLRNLHLFACLEERLFTLRLHHIGKRLARASNSFRHD
jgi:hypothetical protein